ncbi:putative ATPase [Vanrija albida]|uniref:ATPase n=1 Tax=Vanrija albida TaxID=181172 RepID=A0ABR3Q4D3_9TREE
MSSPPPKGMDEGVNADAEQVIVVDEEDEPVVNDAAASQRATRLKFLLEKSTIYAKIIGDRMERQQIEKAKAEQRAETRRVNKEKREADAAEQEGRSGLREAPPSPVKRKRRGDTKSSSKRVKVEEPVAAKAEPVENPDQREEGDDDQKQYSFRQPELVTGATLRDYQLAGVQWMISLYENGLNGILADEMGLGKTLQTISFLSHLRAKGTWGPFLIVCPLSVLYNWIAEFEKFAPSIPVLMYHGTPEYRAELRATRLQAPSQTGVGNIRKGGNRGKPAPVYAGAKGTNTTATFPIVVTTYDICMIDQRYLSGFQWKFIVVDEGHRLKNLDCKLIRELKTYKSANRMILTGTPLHNNLAELWSLLNFILPDIFDDLDSFQQWFNFDDMQNGTETDGLLNKSSVVQSLHAILKPFLLRRLKVDVEKDLPPKKEYLLYAPLTAPQKNMYQAIVGGDIRDYLIKKKSGGAISGVVDADEEESEAEVEAVEGTDDRPRPKRKSAAVDYHIEEDDRVWLRDLKKNSKSATAEKPVAKLSQRELAIKQATQNVNNMRLQNMVMQLRKVSSHPFLFDWPIDAETDDLVVNDDLVNASGKMLLLNRLLGALFERRHKVLIFSQFTTMLDVIQDWATLYKGYKICRIDGNTKQEDRRAQMHEFNNGGDDPDAPQLFLLSTRAGGLGINLVAADTVIFFDQDWNPQMDLQAQDRAHRIGQTKPVLVFRLVSAHTIESKILQKASNKRKLEALVIQQGKFGKLVDENGRVLLGKSNNRHQSTADLARALLDLDGEEIHTVTADDKIISDGDLDLLLDRSPEAFAREKGWAAGLGKIGAAGREAQLAKGEKTAFEVFVPAKDEAADGLAQMFNGDGDEGDEQ